MCGVFGISAPGREVARLAYFGLYALQHRGQESAGIAVSEAGRLTGLRDLGLVTQVFDESKLSALRGELAIAHTRYSTTGSSAWANAQPLIHHGLVRTVALGHNGNLINADELREELPGRLRSTSDSEVIAALIAADERPLDQAVSTALERIDGAAAVVGLAEGRLFAFRDPYGFRPLVLGRLGNDPVVASETCALDLVGAEFERELRPGELLLAGPDGEESVQVLPRAGRGALCIFEFFYLARPDTRLEGVEVHGARVRMGEQLAAEAPVDADLVLPIPDSGTPAAIGFSRATGISFSEGLIKNRYVHRTFIQPEQGMRDQGIRMKFNPLAEVAGKRLVVVDDSIVRGSTTRQIVQMLFDAGAAEVHVRISSPPVVSPCYYGIDLASEDEMIASRSSVEEVRRAIGATSLAYLSLEGLTAATERPAAALCRACLTREYPTRVPATAGKLRFEVVA
jgi:amidophosphoribosyltransferase